MLHRKPLHTRNTRSSSYTMPLLNRPAHIIPQNQMANSNTSLAGLWMDEGQVHSSKFGQPSPGSVELKTDIAKYYKDSGLDSIAKEVGLIDASGIFKHTPSSKTHTTVQYVAVPLSRTPCKMASCKQEQQPHLLPKTVGVQQVLASPSGRQPMTHMDSSPWSSRKRTADLSFDSDYSDGKRLKGKGEKGGKGLRHFSMKVCEKVQKKGVTSYNEVADELVAEFSDPRNMSPSDQALTYDQKNIRRRVYDALNVLMAMNIISKEKKEIRWIGLPTNSAQECHNLELEVQRRSSRLKHKTSQLQELILQQISFKNLVDRNREKERLHGPPPPSSVIQLPYIIVNTGKKTVIDCSISTDKHEYLFKFDNTFEIHDDIEVLKRMGLSLGLEMGRCSQENLAKALKLVPKALQPYVLDMAAGNSSATLMSGGIRPMESPVDSQQWQQLADTAVCPSASCHGYHPLSVDNSRDSELVVASLQSSPGSFDQNSRSAVDTPSNFSDDDDDSYSDASSHAGVA